MVRCLVLVALVLSLGLGAGAQPQSPPPKSPPQNQPPPRSDRSQEAGESSSKDTRIDLSPPKDDAKSHPYSGSAVSDAESETAGDVEEFHPWDPHRAMKDVEVGDFYLKRKNYRAAQARYREALLYKPNDAIATFRLAQCLEKMGEIEEARINYDAYLKILPHGPLAEEARKGLERLK